MPADFSKIGLSLTFSCLSMLIFEVFNKDATAMTSRMNANLIKVLLFVIIFIVFVIQSMFTEAEGSGPVPAAEAGLAKDGGGQGRTP